MIGLVCLIVVGSIAILYRIAMDNGEPAISMAELKRYLGSGLRAAADPFYGDSHDPEEDGVWAENAWVRCRYVNSVESEEITISPLSSRRELTLIFENGRLVYWHEPWRALRRPDLSNLEERMLADLLETMREISAQQIAAARAKCEAREARVAAQIAAEDRAYMSAK